MLTHSCKTADSSSTRTSPIRNFGQKEKAVAADVRVNCLAPGLIETDISSAMDKTTRAAMREAAFLKRTGNPEEMAETVLYLLSERSSFVTSQTLVADASHVTLP